MKFNLDYGRTGLEVDLPADRFVDRLEFDAIGYRGPRPSPILVAGHLAGVVVVPPQAPFWLLLTRFAPMLTLVAGAVSDPHRDAHINVLGTLSVLRAAAGAASRKVIFASSGGTVYGDARVQPVAEGLFDRFGDLRSFFGVDTCPRDDQLERR